MGLLWMRRDLDDIGATDIAVQPLNKLPYGRIDASKAKFSEGVMFLTYASLISSSDKVCSHGTTRTRNTLYTAPMRL